MFSPFHKVVPLLKRTNDYLDQRHSIFWFITIPALVILIGILDYQTKLEVSLSFFYLLPIALAAWFKGFRLGLATSLACALVYSFDLVIAGLDYSSRQNLIWNTVIILGVFLVVASLTAELRSLIKRQMELAQTDYLTGALNGRRFAQLLQIELDRAVRYQRPFTVIYFDIDDFKLINDNFGHYIGDEALRRSVASMRRQLRSTDVIARLGGDEFAVLMPETDTSVAQIVVDKIKNVFRDEMQTVGLGVTCSIGVLTYVSARRPSVDEIVKMVDDLMYSVKRNGKNGTVYSTVKL